jgi:hypothetical protein
MSFTVILIITVLVIYFAWKLMGTAHKKKPEQRRFSLRKHRDRKLNDEDDDE